MLADKKYGSIYAMIKCQENTAFLKDGRHTPMSDTKGGDTSMYDVYQALSIMLKFGLLIVAILSYHKKIDPLQPEQLGAVNP